MRASEPLWPKGRHTCRLIEALALPGVVLCLAAGCTSSQETALPPSNGYHFDSGTQAEGSTTCAPKTCDQWGDPCGVLPNGCGGTVSCKTCLEGQICGGGGFNICGTSSCLAATCDSAHASCGSISDGCGHVVDCGSCADGKPCNNNQCSCTPTTCELAGASCGSISDGCGHVLDCGSCALDKPCNNNQCSCTPTTCELAGANCGSISDGCGHVLDCGTCNAWQTCGDSVCQCTTDSAQCPVACDGLPPSLGGYRVKLDAASQSWVVRTDLEGHPIKSEGGADEAHTCTIHVERVEAGAENAIVVSPSVREVLFQIVGGGGGGGRHYDPPSTGGGAGAYATGIVDISGAAAPVSFSLRAGRGGGAVDPSCSEVDCNFQCSCGRGAGQPGEASTVTVDGAILSAGGGAGGAADGTVSPGGKYSVSGSTSSTTIALNKVLSQLGKDGQPGPSVGSSGPGGSPACNWGLGATGNQSGLGFGAGGGGGNNSPAGSGAGGLVLLFWTECK